ncbi:hypothetical protein [Staphylococcus pseudoxylosus]|uniref:hypothetical protein n=1 Tax=Staphylococcus pseudoxylosus TaxID=2282419 RepID=UPI002DB5B6F8|nr:hypothetical protein [Staphylococcus pseudoxylosus]MEB6038226.1 hypothetical protein [Staphylococcus pseudoxylosus]
MIEVYVQWSCETFNLPYNAPKYFDSWSTRIDCFIKEGFKNVDYNIPDNNEQLTIFDYDMYECIAI